MAKLANTFVTTDAVGNREDISDKVTMITPQETPLLSAIGYGKAKNIYHQWEYDEIEAPTDTAQPEGNEFSYDATAPAVRVGNYCQILSLGWSISKSQEESDNVGRAEKVSRQKFKKGVALRKSFEFSALKNQGSVASDPRVMGGLPSWLETNTDRAGTGADGGFNSGTGLTVAATDGTQRTFTRTQLDNVMQKVFNSGGNPSILMCSTHIKTVVSGFMSDAGIAALQYEANLKKNALIGTVEMYKGDFGTLSVVPNRIMSLNADRARNVYVIDPNMLSFNFFRKIHTVDDIGVSGDAIKGQVIGEGTLAVKNEAGLGVIADVFGLTATS